MKSKEELNALKAEAETVNKKLAELTEEDLEQVPGGKKPVKYRFNPPEWVRCPNCGLDFKTDMNPTTCPSCKSVFNL